MGESTQRIKSNIRKSDDNIEEIIASVQPLTRSDVKKVLTPLRRAEENLEKMPARSQIENEDIHDVLRIELLFSKAMLALHGIEHGTRGEPLDDYRGLTIEQKLEQIDKQLAFAENRLSSLDQKTYDEYFDEPYEESEEALFVLKERVEELRKELSRRKVPEAEGSPTERIPQTTPSTTNESSNGGFLIGAFLATVGIGFMITGGGAIIGIALILLGGTIMFPTLSAIIVGLMMGGVIILLL